MSKIKYENLLSEFNVIKFDDIEDELKTLLIEHQESEFRDCKWFKGTYLYYGINEISQNFYCFGKIGPKEYTQFVKRLEEVDVKSLIKLNELEKKTKSNKSSKS